MNENVQSMIQEQLRESTEIMKWRRENWDQKLTQWPPGWEIIKNLEEDTSVNMSPFKDAVNNSQTKKSNQAISKIDELGRKR